MKVIAQPKAGKENSLDKTERLSSPLDMALCTIIPKGNGQFSIQLPAADWEDGLEAIYTFTYDGKTNAAGATLPAAMRVVPITRNIASHCVEATDATVTEDCVLSFEQGKDIDIESEVSVQLSGDEIRTLNDFLARWK